MAMENNPFEDVFPIEHGDFSIAMLLYGRVHHKLFLWIPYTSFFPLDPLDWSPSWKLRRYLKNTFDDKVETTIGMDFQTKTVQLLNGSEGT